MADMEVEGAAGLLGDDRESGDELPPSNKRSREACRDSESALQGRPASGREADLERLNAMLTEEIENIKQKADKRIQGLVTDLQGLREAREAAR